MSDARFCDWCGSKVRVQSMLAYNNNVTVYSLLLYSLSSRPSQYIPIIFIASVNCVGAGKNIK